MKNEQVNRDEKTAIALATKRAGKLPGVGNTFETYVDGDGKQHCVVINFRKGKLNPPIICPLDPSGE